MKEGGEGNERKMTKIEVRRTEKQKQGRQEDVGRREKRRREK